MATPITASELVKALQAEELDPRLKRMPGWTTHNRNHMGPWGPVHGVMIHHTAGVSAGMAAYCFTGSTDLPGPLCHALAAKDGSLHLIGHGRANHAGRIARNAHSAVVSEDPVHPRPEATDSVDGNQHYYGLEIENRGDGSDPYPALQYDTAVKWAAALCRFHGWSEHSVIGHKEATRRKIDPSFDMNRFRADVAMLLRPDPAPAPTPRDDHMKFTSLGFTRTRVIQPDATFLIPWDQEHQDGPNDHPSFGRHILSGEHYTGHAHFAFSQPLPIGITARFAHELADGTLSGEPTHSLTAGPSGATIGGTGRVPEGRNLVVQLFNHSDTPVTLYWAAVRLGSWPL